MTELLTRAQAYVAASNDHDLAAIEPMLAPDCVYQSDAVGRHDGAQAILAMMEGFFASFPDVHWQAGNYRLCARDAVEFSFVITLQGNSSPGAERLHFDGDGRVRLIEVMRQDTAER